MGKKGKYVCLNSHWYTSGMLALLKQESKPRGKEIGQLLRLLNGSLAGRMIPLSTSLLSPGNLFQNKNL